jgi:metal-responsive CopG/Arc/MetJ family transcriptional regulator
VTKTYKLEVDAALAIDLDAFCAANRGAPRVGIIRTAIREYIDAARTSDPELDRRFGAAKETILARIAAGSNLHLLRRDGKGTV